MPNRSITPQDIATAVRRIRAAIYPRVSTTEQLDNSSPDEQIRRCLEYCEKMGYEVVEVGRIDAISGSFVLARSLFNEYLNKAADGQLDVIVVDIPDRLGRGDAIAQCELLAKMNNCHIEYATPGRDTNTIEGIALHATDQLVSGMEKWNIRRRTTGGRYAWARKGRIIASGKRPYGYDYHREFDESGRKTSTVLQIIEEEAEIVRRIYTWYVVDGWSVYRITVQLNAEGVKGPRQSRWNRATVHNILANETYAGTWHYGKINHQVLDAVGKVRHRQEHRDKSQWVAVPCPAIISRDLWEAAQKARSKRGGGRPTRWHYLLKGRIRDKCGYIMRGSTKPVGYRKPHAPEDIRYISYYYCPRNDRQRNPRCNTHNLRCDIVDVLVWDKIKQVLKDENLLFAGIQTDRAEQEKATRTIQGTIAGLQAQNAKVQSKLDRWLDLYGDGGMSKAQYNAKKKDAEEEYKKREREIADWQKKLDEHRVLTVEQEGELREYRETVLEGIDSATFEDKLNYLEWLKIECAYDEDTAQMVVTGILGDHALSTEWAKHPREWYRKALTDSSVIIPSNTSCKTRRVAPRHPWQPPR